LRVGRSLGLEGSPVAGGDEGGPVVGVGVFFTF
jgi:hypothetical protein